MNFIPKIEYGPEPTVIQFQFPPEGDFLKWEETSNQKTSRSFNGRMQTTWGYNEVIIKPTFNFVNEFIKNQVQEFFDNWASFGKSFAYFPSSDEPEFYAVVLAKKQFAPDILIPSNTAGEFEWRFILEFELVNTPLIIGGGANVDSGGYVSRDQTVIQAGTIILGPERFQSIVLTSTTPVILADPPFSSPPEMDRTTVMLIGSSDTNTQTINYSNVNNGILLFGNVVLRNNYLLTIHWVQARARWIEVSRSF